MFGRWPPCRPSRSDAVAVWFDARGAGLAAGSILLVEACDIDPAEQRRIDAGALTAVPPGPDLPERLRAAAAGLLVYVHIDCDALAPSAVPTGYRVDGGAGSPRRRRVHRRFDC